MSPMARSSKGDFAKFFANPSVETLPEYLRNHLGEQNFLDFKEKWPEKQDLARHVLAMANCDGGAIIIGVKDGTPADPIGIQGDITDKTDIARQLSPYLPTKLMKIIAVEDFDYDNAIYDESIRGKKFQGLFVSKDPSGLPYFNTKSLGGHPAKSIFVRKEFSSKIADAEDIAALAERCIKAATIDHADDSLQNDLFQLKLLYDQIPQFMPSSLAMAAIFADNFLWDKSRKNPRYPDIEYEAFIRECIDTKMTKIRSKL